MRLLVVLALLAVFVAARRRYRRWRRAVENDRRPTPHLPAELVAGAARTWVVFTTPACGSCGPVTERLRREDPGARVVTVDATAEPQLAGAFRVRSAPTVLLADGQGRVQARLVGAAAVDGYVRSPQ